MPNKDPHREDPMREITIPCGTPKLLDKMMANRYIIFWRICGLFLVSSLGSANVTLPFVRIDHDIKHALSENRIVLGVFFDLEKAYDTA